MFTSLVAKQKRLDFYDFSLGYRRSNYLWNHVKFAPVKGFSLQVFPIILVRAFCAQCEKVAVLQNLRTAAHLPIRRADIWTVI